MKALTLTQPWATLVAIGAKQIETRSWGTKYRGEIAIHAAKNFPWSAQYLCFKEPFRNFLIDQYSFIQGGEIYFGKHKFPLGAVVATCRLVNIFRIPEVGRYFPSWGELLLPPGEPERTFGNYTPGRYAWILDDIKALPEPIPAKGSLGLWEWIS